MLRAWFTLLALKSVCATSGWRGFDANREQRTLAASFNVGEGSEGIAGGGAGALGSRWVAAHDETAPDGLLAVSAYGAKDVQITAGALGQSNAVVLKAKVRGADAVAKTLSAIMAEQDPTSAHETLTRDLSAGTLLCSPAAFCHASTPVMATLGAAVDASARATHALLEPMFADGEGGAVPMDLDALLRAPRAKMADLAAAWEVFAGGVSAWAPADAPRAAAGAGVASLEPTRRDVDAILAIAQDAINGLAHMAERRLAHRDIKPANIMLDGAHRVAKLIDFGTVCMVADSPGAGGRNDLAAAEKTKTALRCKNNDQVGTTTYFSPSLFLAGGYPIPGGATNVDVSASHAPRADLFALGLSLLEVFYGDKIQSPLPSSLAADPMTPKDMIADNKGGKLYSVMQNTALAHFVAASDVPTATRDEVSRARLLTVIRIAASSPLEHITQPRHDDNLKVPFFARSVLNAVVPGVVAPRSSHADVAEHQCIPQLTPTGGCLYYALRPCRDKVPEGTAEATLEWVATKVRATQATETSSIPRITTSGTWAPGAGGQWAGSQCVSSAAAALSADRPLNDVLAAPQPPAAAAAALRAILDVVRGLLAVGLDAEGSPAVNFAALEAGVARARELLAAAGVAAAPPVPGPAAVFARATACEARCTATIASVRASAAHSCGAAPAAAAAAAALADYHVCETTLAELAASGAREKLADASGTGFTQAAARTMCRAAVCAGDVPARRPLAGALAKAPSGAGSYSPYSFALECQRGDKPSDASSVALLWAGGGGVKSLRRWVVMKARGAIPHGDEVGRGTVASAPPVAPCAACPKDGSAAVAACLCVPLVNARAKNVRHDTLELKIKGIDAKQWAAAVAAFKAECPGLP